MKSDLFFTTNGVTIMPENNSSNRFKKWAMCSTSEGQNRSSDHF